MKRFRGYKIEDGTIVQPILHARPEEGASSSISRL